MKNQIVKYLLAALLVVCSLPNHASTPDYTQTKYPLVLVHGFFGFDNIGAVDYWYGISAALASSGAKVYVSSVAAANTTEVRGEQLLTQVKQILAVTGAAKVNLIGHSHGGPTSRYVASVRPDLIASVTSIAGPNTGTPVADIVLGLAPPGSLSGEAIYSVTNGMATLISTLSGSPAMSQDVRAALTSFSTAGMQKFNAAHPDGLPTTPCGEGAAKTRGVFYFSWSGAQPYTNPLDSLDPALASTSLAFAGEKNDGLISSCSSRLGTVIRDDYRMNHLDEINQTVGLVNIFEVNPTTVYRQHANRLKGLGL